MGVLFLLCHYLENAMAAGTTTSRANRTVDSDEIFQVDLLKSGNEKTRKNQDTHKFSYQKTGILEFKK